MNTEIKSTEVVKNSTHLQELEQHVRTLLGSTRECLRVLEEVYNVYYYDTDNEIEKELFENIEEVWDRTLDDMIEVLPDSDYVKTIEKEVNGIGEVNGYSEFVNDYTHSIYLPKRNGKWLKIDSKNNIEIVDDKYR